MPPFSVHFHGKSMARLHDGLHVSPVMLSELGHATNGHQSSPTQKPPKLVVASYSICIRRAPLLPFGSIWGLGSPVGCHGVLPRSTAYVLQFGPRHCGDLLRLIEFLQRQRSRMAFSQPFDIPLILLVALHPRALLDLRSAGLGSFRGQGGET